MALKKIKLYKYIELYSKPCGISDLKNKDISGINKDKEFFEPSNQVGEDTSKYKIVPPNYFACNLMHVGRDVVLPIAYNHTDKDKIVSPAYFVFRLKENDDILSDYFFMYLKSAERDRYFWFNTDSSVRDGMSWDDFINVEFDVPDIDIQKKYVSVYKNLTKNQTIYEQGINDLKLVCDSTIEKFRREYECIPIGKYINRIDARNTDKRISVVKNVSVYKVFNEPTTKVNRNELENYKIVKPNQIAFVQTTHNEHVFAYAINNFDYDVVVSSVDEVFETDEKVLLPHYLCLFFNRTEFDRYARFHSWGSARETFTWDDLKQVKIPIPPINIQKDITNIFSAYTKRKNINEKLKEKIVNICPILITGAIKEGEIVNE